MRAKQNKLNTIPSVLRNTVDLSGDSTAMIYESERISYATLHELVLNTSCGLAKLGIKSGDRVAFWLPNTSAYLVLYLACMQLNAIAVAVNTRFRSSEVADIVNRSGAKSLILWPLFRKVNFLEILSSIEDAAFSQVESVVVYSEAENNVSLKNQLPGSLQSKKLASYQELIGQSGAEIDNSSADAGCNIFTTSGTTSAPKFVLHSHRSISNHAEEVWRNLEPLIKNDAFFHTLPFCGVFGFNHFSAALIGARANVIQSAFDAHEAVELIDLHKVHYISATDDMLLALLDADDRNPALPSLTCCGYGAFNMPPEEITERASARGLKLVGLYGMSEVQALFARREHTQADEQRYLPGGKLISPHASVRARNPENKEILPHGESGELEFKGPSLLIKYFKNDSATEELIRQDGYLKSGDLGYTCSTSEFVFQARMGDTLRLGGYLVAPEEIETYLIEHDSVEAAQVVAVRIHDKMRAYAFIIPAQNKIPEQEKLKTYCLDGLAKFKVPVVFHCMDAFPTTKSPNGTKIQRAKLREIAETETQNQSTRASLR